MTDDQKRGHLQGIIAEIEFGLLISEVQQSEHYEHNMRNLEEQLARAQSMLTKLEGR